MRLECHFDESGTDAAELTLAGYLFEAQRIDRFCEAWDAVLAEYNVPFFHMVDCAHGAPPFDHLKKVDLIRMQMRLMRLIKRYSTNGVVCNISNNLDNAGSSYAEAVELALCTVMEWAEQTAFAGQIAYFLEAGAKGLGLVETIFGRISQDPARTAAHRYGGHAFKPKGGNPGVQAADLLAWQYHNYTKKRADAGVTRLDLRALLRHPHHISDKCGKPARDARLQSVEESQTRIETVYYLPTISEKEATQTTLLVAGSDFTFFESDWSPVVLACPNCWRAVCEMPLSHIQGIALKCWCGTYCYTPPLMAPFSGPEPSRAYRALRRPNE